MKQDLDYLIKTIFSSHPNPYAYISRQEFKVNKKDAYSAIKQAMTIDDFYIIAQHLTASLQNGHTSLFIPDSWPARLNKGKFIPILLKVIDEKVYLFQNYGDETLPIGSEIISINGTPAISVARDMASYFPREGRIANYGTLETPKLALYMMAMKFKNAQSISVEIKNNAETNTYQIAAIPIKKISEKTQKYCARDDQKRYNGFLNCDFLEKYNTGLITINCFTNKEGFKKIITDYFKKLKSQKAKNLIIDLRNCPGGDSRIGDILLDYIASKPWRQNEKIEVRRSRLYINQMYSKSFLSQLFLPKVNSVKKAYSSFNYPNVFNFNRFKGKVYLLIGRNSNSSSTSFAAAVKYYKFGTLIGEETGDNISSYGDCLHFTLPNSGLKGTVASKYLIAPSEEANTRQGVQPDYKVYGTNANEDPVLEFTLKQISDAERHRL